MGNTTQSASRLFVIPMAVGLTVLPRYDAQKIPVPVSIHEFDISPSKPRFNIPNESITGSVSDTNNLVRFRVVEQLASRMMAESKDIPDKYARLINERFWDLL